MLKMKGNESCTEKMILISHFSLSPLPPQHINTPLLATLVFSHRALKIILLKFMLFKSVYYTTPALFPNPLLLF